MIIYYYYILLLYITYYKKIVILTWIIAVMFVATILTIFHKIASLRFQYASVYVARKFASAATCKMRKTHFFKFERCDHTWYWQKYKNYV